MHYIDTTRNNALRLTFTYDDPALTTPGVSEFVSVISLNTLIDTTGSGTRWSYYTSASDV